MAEGGSLAWLRDWLRVSDMDTNKSEQSPSSVRLETVMMKFIPPLRLSMLISVEDMDESWRLARSHAVRRRRRAGASLLTSEVSQLARWANLERIWANHTPIPDIL